MLFHNARTFSGAKIKLTGFNGVPFHKNIVYIVTVYGLTIILSLINLLCSVLIGTQPHYYRYLLPTILSFSLHYLLGAYIALEKTEMRIVKNLKTECHAKYF
jgi:hypothetical protein